MTNFVILHRALQYNRTI